MKADALRQTYSNGLSEVILGKAIKKLGLPREEIVVMTKVRTSIIHTYPFNIIYNSLLLLSSGSYALGPLERSSSTPRRKLRVKAT